MIYTINVTIKKKIKPKLLKEKIMNISEACEKLKNGQKIRHNSWDRLKYIFIKYEIILKENGSPVNNIYELFNFKDVNTLNFMDILSTLNNDWSIYYEPMTFTEGLQKLKEGYKIKRNDEKIYYIVYDYAKKCICDNKGYAPKLSMDDVEADDWIIIN
jgi:hypothetical protein